MTYEYLSPFIGNVITYPRVHIKSTREWLENDNRLAKDEN